MEIERLHKMLTDAGIEHLWINRTPSQTPTMARRLFGDVEWGWQIRLLIEEPFFSAIEGFGSYGYGIHGEQGDRIEIMVGDEVTGHLTAEEVFFKIKELLCGRI